MDAIAGGHAAHAIIEDADCHVSAGAPKATPHESLNGRHYALLSSAPEIGRFCSFI